MSATQQTAETTTSQPRKAAANGNGKHNPTTTRRRSRSSAPAAQAAADPAAAAKPGVAVVAKIGRGSREVTQAGISQHPLVAALFQDFPVGADISDCKSWMDTAAAVMKRTCKFEGTLSVTVA